MRKPLTPTEWKKVIDDLVENGCKKINFAGGEPTLIKFLPDLICYAHSKGIFVSIISNGTGITDEFLIQCGNSLNLIGLSVDSTSDETEQRLGRCLNSANYSHIDMIKRVAHRISDYGIPLKINTTLTSINWQDNMHSLIQELNPCRWKVFQVHSIHGINDAFFEQYGELTNELFADFLTRHAELHPVGEFSEIIKESYCMITPDGRFYQDTDNTHHYSDPILAVGVTHAFAQIQYDATKYLTRRGNFFKDPQIIFSY
jgi:radical S-adenosyl methionine domain-containing protein 2